MNLLRRWLADPAGIFYRWFAALHDSAWRHQLDEMHALEAELAAADERFAKFQRHAQDVVRKLRAEREVARKDAEAARIEAGKARVDLELETREKRKLEQEMAVAQAENNRLWLLNERDQARIEREIAKYNRGRAKDETPQADPSAQ